MAQCCQFGSVPYKFSGLLSCLPGKIAVGGNFGGFQSCWRDFSRSKIKMFFSLGFSIVNSFCGKLVVWSFLLTLNKTVTVDDHACDGAWKYNGVKPSSRGKQKYTTVVLGLRLKFSGFSRFLWQVLDF